MLGAEREVKSVYVKAGLVRLAFNPMIDHGDRSVQAHQAAECAGDQNLFWPMHDLLFNNQDDLYGGNIKETIRNLTTQLVGLDQSQFATCFDEDRYVERVSAQDQQRRALGIRTRPTLDINGQVVIGVQSFDLIKGIIEPLLGE